MKYPSGPGLIVAAALALTLSSLAGKCADAQKTGLEFLDPIQEFRGLSLQMSEEQLKAEAEKQGLYSKPEALSDSADRTNAVSYWLLTPEGENVIVGFASGKCTGIQRMQPIPKTAIKDEIGEAEYRKWMEERKSASRAGDGDGWSEPVKGLRGRLHLLAPERPGSPFCRVLLELENVDEILGQKHIRFSPGKLSLRVTEQTGKELPIATGPYDGVSPVWETIALPHGGSTKFKIEICGHGYRPNTDKLIVDVGSDKAWVIPQDGKAYYLSGSLTIEKKEGDHSRMDWSGTLDLKRTEIPRVTSGAGVDEKLTRQVSDILKESQKFIPGKSTRAELLKVFTTEGGLSSARHRTFVHRSCPYIKVDVDFTLATPIIEDERPTDVVGKISTLYLAWSVMD